LPSEISIRKARKSELPLIMEMSVDELPAELSEVELRYLGRVKKEFARRQQALIKRGGNEFYVAEVGGNPGIAGYVWFGVSERMFSGVKVGWIYDILVLPTHRGKGVGEALLKHALRVGRERKFREIGLMVNAKNAVARSLYEKLGFQTQYMIMARDEGKASPASNS
jgi:ribosomal protein S18 acetylase RimI-like enzyme